MAADFRRLVESLAGQGVAFVVIGGVALVLHGSSRTTRDLDICYARDADNLDRLARALAELHPRLRGAPEGLPFRLDARTLRSGLNFALTTDAGDLDLLGEVTGVGGHAEAAADAVTLDLYGHGVAIMSLDRLEQAKVAAGRVKDLADLAEIQELRRQAGEGPPS